MVARASFQDSDQPTAVQFNRVGSTVYSYSGYGGGNATMALDVGRASWRERLFSTQSSASA